MSVDTGTLYIRIQLLECHKKWVCAGDSLLNIVSES